ncbi:MAG: hypothetical protein WDZ93_02950 [Candidatus Paceibacterota bacterium]
MEQNQPQPEQNQAPDISDAELKMPEEQFGESEPVKEGRGMLVPLLILLILALAGILGALVLWGEELMGIILGEQTPEQEEAMESTATTSDEMTADTTGAETAATQPDFNAIEAELEGDGFTTFENDMGAIDSEIENDTQSTTTTE